jgi:glycosyltransferase
MVCLNSEKTIQKSIKSFYNQKYINKELIIIDGGSSDNTVKIIKGTKGVGYFEKKNNLGLYASLNYGIRKSKGEIIGILHSDDEFFNENILEKVNDGFEKNLASIDYIYSDIVFVDKSNKIKRKWIVGNLFQNDIFFGNLPPHTGIFVKKNSFFKTGYYNENLKISSDIEYIFTLFSEKSLKGKYLNIFTLKMKLGGLSTKSLKNILYANFECFIALKNVKIGYMRSLLVILLKVLRKPRQLI